MTITLVEASKIYAEVSERGEKVSEERLYNSAHAEIFTLEGWTYKFCVDRGIIRKIEESNHREFIEVWVK